MYAKPLSPRERGWGEGTSEAWCNWTVRELRPHPHPPLWGTFSRWGKGGFDEIHELFAHLPYFRLAAASDL
ncbi:hypothetical protein CFBP8129_24090 [Xanthomonas hortorum pv. gardneri]|uniref:Uncharacterized protein n=1 Tax=Xanthomonas hortorum pv. gardneri TaxID=2754056 RepID=A0A6V7DI77_9XANT|nr:hypothetical protein CFBP2044_22360 [Xanthomonas hortorum pv. cynarae]CAD0331766.1 hypothetical protein CFBP2044_22360 [Xanthomonas hortorum pv. cynarae]CAD0334924.1 hypothetical protein CFBP8129_24090 [Xanthomonas hortorum pv. gardneri]CAD0334933.1 hypothetical protein CFBP8129_24090 [Xanthomonas hortorum pv. gardneri]CAH2708281.1 hypothetical protein NCPPB1935_10995 [Xanthomonas campestris pv. nigromaculans]